ALTLMPDTDIDRIRKRLAEVDEAKRLAGIKGAPSFWGVTDVGDSLERAEKGAQLTTGELLSVARLLSCVRTLKSYPEKDYPFGHPFYVYFSRLITDNALEKAITSAILAEDMISDDASPELARIRRKMKGLNSKVKEQLQKYITSSEYQKHLQDNLITQRQGRYVIPVKAESKGEIKGLVHDISSSGATLFVEPAPVVEINNNLRILLREEEMEIEKILASLSAMVARSSGLISLDYYNVTELALIFAKAELSFRLNGSAPRMTEGKEVRILRARHPLLDKHKVVPTDIRLGGDVDTLVITSPNTGGKTVSLKTLGLLSMMAQTGLHTPCNSSSVFCIFEDFYPDIGDEQSIEQSLSTFSAHMKNIVAITERVNDRSLVLFDELGAGTDPVEGAALAISVLEHVRGCGALCAATTHYAELKAYALETDRVCNGSCEFDVETLAPTYHLIIGTPGKSNAFAISRRLGLSDHIISHAQSLVSADNRRFELVIEKLEEQRVLAEKHLEKVLAEKAEFEKERAEIAAKIKKQEAEAQAALDRAKNEATGILKSAKVASDYVLEKAEAAKKSAELADAKREIKQYLMEADDKINPLVERKPEEGYVLPRPLVKGDRVLVFSLGKEGTVEAPADKSGTVSLLLGSMHFKTKQSNLKLLEPKSEKEKTKGTVSSSGGTAASFSPEIDLRGELADDAWFLLDKYMDSALMVKMETVRVIHGKG
ncbi:MAG: endonuclease MutS2, partial [Clostridia bacterium]|nr:endonuclease MutS2 [Clostridia bacterium]